MRTSLSAHTARSLSLLVAALALSACAKEVSYSQFAEQSLVTAPTVPATDEGETEKSPLFGFHCGIYDLREYYADQGCKVAVSEDLPLTSALPEKFAEHLASCGMVLPDNFDTLAHSQYFGLNEVNWEAGDYDRTFPGVDGKTFPQREWYGVRCGGTMQPKESGTYFFAVTSDDGSRLFVNGRKVIQMNKLQSPTTGFGVATLKKGQSPKISVEYFQGPRNQTALQVWISNGPVAANGSKPVFPTDYRLVNKEMLELHPLAVVK